MKVILKQAVKKLGNAGDVVEVADGYARNYLFPKNLAVPAEQSALKVLTAEQKQQERKRQQEAAKVKALVKALEEKPVEVKAKAGEGGKLFGSVTAQDIADAIQVVHGVEIDRRKLQLKEPIKQLGTFQVTYAPLPEISGVVTVNVVAEE